jgi:hypothetical protein
MHRFRFPLLVTLASCLALLGLAGVAWAAPSGDELTVCAKPGPLRTASGSPIAFGSYLLPPLWSVRRDIHFQVCTPDGRPRSGRVVLEVAVEPLTAAFGAASAGNRSVITDDQGRFSGMYGAASYQQGPAWPEGFTSVELHHFRLNGRTIATYVLELEAKDVRFSRR